jgi:hypothetical protein
MTLTAVETWLHDARPGERIIYAIGPAWLVAAARVEEKEKRAIAQQQLVAVAAESHEREHPEAQPAAPPRARS